MRKKTIALIIGLIFTLALTSCDNNDDSERKALAFLERSIAYEKQGQYRASLLEMRNAIQLSPDNPDLIDRYAQLLIFLGTPNQAETFLNNFSDNNSMLATLALAQLKQGKFVSARETINRWETDENSTEFRRLSALASYLSGNRNDALAAYREISGISQTPVAVKSEFIELLLQANQDNEAQEWISQFLEDYPNEASFHYFNAVLLHKNGNLEKAESELTQALISLPETDILLLERLRVLELLANVLTEMNRMTEALVYRKIIREANPDIFIANQQYADALNAASLGDLQTARAAFEDILDQFPNNQQASLMLGLIHLEQGDIETGEQLLSTNLDAETSPVSLIQATALAQAEQGKSAEALSVLDRALLARPDDTALLSLYGVISLNSDNELQGLQALNKALGLDPNRTRIHLLLAQYHAEHNNLELAFGHLRTGFRTNPEDWATTGYFLNLLIDHKENEEAREVRNLLLSKYSDDSSAQWLIATADYRFGNIESSISTLESLHRQDSKNINVVTALAGIYFQQERFEQASAMWLKALGIAPGNEQHLRSLLNSKSKVFDNQKLVDWLLEKANLNPEVKLPLHAAAVELMIGLGDIESAQDIADQYQEIDQPKSRQIRANVFRGQAIKLAQEQDWEGASMLMNEAYSLVPRSTVLAIDAAKLEVKLNRLDRALVHLDSLLDLQPDNMLAHREKTSLIARMEDTASALSYIESIWQTNPNSVLANTYFRLVETEKPTLLAGIIRNYLKIEPQNTIALTMLAGTHLNAGEHEEAIELYQSAISFDENNVTAQNNLAWLLKDSNQARALKHSEKAAELAPNSAAVLDTYGWILHLNGQAEKAIQVLERALELDASNVEIRRHLEQVKI